MITSFKPTVDLKKSNYEQKRSRFIKNFRWRTAQLNEIYYDELKFKQLRDQYVDAAINDLGVIFFEFKVVSRSTDPEVIESLRYLYSGGREYKKITPVFNKEIIPLVNGGLFFCNVVKPLSHPKIKDFYEIESSGMEEFVYLTVDKERPPFEKEMLRFFETFQGDDRLKDWWDDKDVLSFEYNKIYTSHGHNALNDFEMFSLSGLLAVRTLVGYNECKPLLRKAEYPFVKLKRPSQLLNWEKRYYSPILTSEGVKRYWDDLVSSASLFGEESQGLTELSTFHGWHAYRFAKQPFEPFNWAYYSNESNSSFGTLNSIYVGGDDVRALESKTNIFHFRNGNGKIYNKDKTCVHGLDNEDRFLSNIIGVPAKCSYGTPAVLYNLFEVFSKIFDIEFIDNFYYKRFGDRFLKLLGDECWFKEHYFYIVEILLSKFGCFVTGVDYYKLFSLQIENVLIIMKQRPLNKTWRLIEPPIFKTNQLPTSFVSS